jgi:hypothetical protein
MKGEKMKNNRRDVDRQPREDLTPFYEEPVKHGKESQPREDLTPFYEEPVERGKNSAWELGPGHFHLYGVRRHGEEHHYLDHFHLYGVETHPGYSTHLDSE